MDNKTLTILKKGFSEDGKIYCVVGGNTYLIKDKLKNIGFHYSKLLGWHSKVELPVPENYSLVCCYFDELFLWEEKYQMAFPYIDIKERIKNKESK